MLRRCNFSDILDGYFYWKKRIITVFWNIYQKLSVLGITHNEI